MRNLCINTYDVVSSFSNVSECIQIYTLVNFVLYALNWITQCLL